MTLPLALTEIWILSSQAERAHPCDLSWGNRENLFQVFWFQRSCATRTHSLSAYQMDGRGFAVKQGKNKKIPPRAECLFFVQLQSWILCCALTRKITFQWLTGVFDLAAFSQMATPQKSSTPAGTCFAFLLLHSSPLWPSLFTRTETRFVNRVDSLSPHQ